MCSPPVHSCEDREHEGLRAFWYRVGLGRWWAFLGEMAGPAGSPLSFLGRWGTSPVPRQPGNRDSEEASTVPWGPACCRDPLPLMTCRTLQLALPRGSTRPTDDPWVTWDQVRPCSSPSSVSWLISRDQLDVETVSESADPGSPDGKTSPACLAPAHHPPVTVCSSPHEPRAEPPARTRGLQPHRALPTAKA